MPETVPGAFVTLPSHVNAAQWQTFEMRMRQRRAARLILRAQTAIEQGHVEEAAEALDEARTLDSSAPDIETLRARIAPPEQPATTVPVVPVVPAFKSPAGTPVPVVPAFRPAAGTPVPVVPAFKSPAANPVPVVPAFRPAAGSPVSELPLHDLSAAETTPNIEASTAGRRVRGALAIAASLGLVTLLALWNFSARVAPKSAPARVPPPVAAAPVADEPTLARAAVTIATPAVTETGTSGVAPSERQPVEAAALTSAPAPVDNPDATPPAAPPTPAAVPEPVDRVAPLREERAEPITSLPVRDGLDAIGAAAAPVPEPPAVAPPSPPAPPEAPAPVDESPSVRRVLSQYEAAYSSLDASAAKRVWPGLDSRALSRAFDGLQSQRVSLRECDVSVNRNGARADCHGSAEWTPKVGGGSRSEARSWSFDLRKGDGGEWRIVSATVR